MMSQSLKPAALDFESHKLKWFTRHDFDWGYLISAGMGVGFLVCVVFALSNFHWPSTQFEPNAMGSGR